MPTINEVLERTAKARPDAYDDKTKAGWLLELDGKLYREVILRHRLPGPACRRSERPDYPRTFPEDADKPLLVKPPYDNLYDLYLYAQVDLYNREIDHYNNSAALFDAAMDEWRRAWHREHRPIGAGYYRHVF